MVTRQDGTGSCFSPSGATSVTMVETAATAPGYASHRRLDPPAAREAHPDGTIRNGIVPGWQRRKSPLRHNAHPGHRRTAPPKALGAHDRRLRRVTGDRTARRTPPSYRGHGAGQHGRLLQDRHVVGQVPPVAERRVGRHRWVGRAVSTTSQSTSASAIGTTPTTRCQESQACVHGQERAKGRRRVA